MDDGFYQYVFHKTAGFVFSDDTTHGERVRRLVTEARKMALRYYYKTPSGFAKEFGQDDWIQHAMITLFECIEAYDRKRPFDNYVRFIIKRRLEDQRRKLYRQNPEIDSEKGDGGKRLFSELSEPIQRTAQSHKTNEPEQRYLMEEARQILLACIQRLEETHRMIFAKHELEKVSFKKLFKLLPDFNKSFASFKRWYKTDIFDQVKRCVQSELAE